MYSNKQTGERSWERPAGMTKADAEKLPGAQWLASENGVLDTAFREAYAKLAEKREKNEQGPGSSSN